MRQKHVERIAEISKPHEPVAATVGHAWDSAPASASLSPVMQLQQQAGNQAVQQLLRSACIQAKLAISNPDDPEEREADNIANTIMRKHAGAPASSPCPCSGDGEMCEECQQKQTQPTIQRRPSAPPAPAHVPRIVSDVLRSPGHPLDSATRAFFEPRFGHDFSHVRIHTDSHAADSARSVNALAYTAGSRIVFAPGQYSPDSTPGRTLLAHELVHVGKGSNDDDLHRQVDPGTLTVGGPARPKSDWYEYRSVRMSTDPEFMKSEMRHLIARRGLQGADEWYQNLIAEKGVNPETSGLGVSATTYGYRGRVRSPLDMQRDMQEEQRRLALPEALPLAMTVYPQIRAEALFFLSTFGDRAKKTAKDTLEANREQTEKEALRYGLSGQMVEKIVTVATSMGPMSIPTMDPQFQMDPTLPSSGGLQKAAGILFQRRQEIEKKKSERDSHFHNYWFAGLLVIDTEYWSLTEEVNRMEKDYKDLQSFVTDQYPILGRYSELDESLDPLKNIATQGPGPETANLIGAQIYRTVRDINKSKQGLDDGDVNVWRLESIVGLTAHSMSVEPGSMADRLVKDKVVDEQPGILQGIALAVLNIAALLLAPVTAGGSLVVAAAVNVAVTASHVQEYLLQKAMAGSALQRAQALSQTDPSLFWLAVEIVGTAFDVGTAASAMLKAFRALAPVVKAAEAAKTGEEAVRGTEAVRAAAREVGAGEKAEAIIAHIKDARGGEEAVIKDLAKLPGEKEALGQLGKAGAAEAAEEIGSASVKAAEGPIKVSKAGHIFLCESPCTILREKYANIFIKDKKLSKELMELETRGKEVSAAYENAQKLGSKQLQEAKEMADQLKRDVKEFERSIGNAYPEAISAAPSDRAAIHALQEAEGEGAVAAGRLPKEPAELEKFRPSDDKLPAGVRKNDELWTDYKKYFDDRLNALKQGQAGVKPPLSWENYSEFLGKFRRGTQYQEQVLGTLKSEAVTRFSQMEKPVVLSNVGVAGKAEGEATKFVDQLVVDEATVGVGKAPKIEVFSNKSRQFDELFQQGKVSEIRQQVVADAKEAIDKYGGTITLRRRFEGDSALKTLFNQDIKVGKVTLVYDKSLTTNPKVLKLIEGAKSPGVEIIFL